MKYLDIVATLVLVMLCVIAYQLYSQRPAVYRDKLTHVSLKERKELKMRTPLVIIEK